MQHSIELLQQLMRQNGHLPGVFETINGLTTMQCRRCDSPMYIRVAMNGAPGAAVVKKVCRPSMQAQILPIRRTPPDCISKQAA